MNVSRFISSSTSIKFYVGVINNLLLFEGIRALEENQNNGTIIVQQKALKLSSFICLMSAPIIVIV